ncbi:MAG: BON domain-containing protein [Gemmatimonadaceae bacterium]
MTFRYRDSNESSSTGFLFLAVGAAAGVAAGMFLAQRFGGLGAVAQRVRERFDTSTQEERLARRHARFEDYEGVDEEDEIEDELDAADPYASADEELEERVLEAFRNDPILAERAVDIGAVGEGIIELTGWVHAENEADHAVTLTRGVPGVETVVNRLAIRREEDELTRTAQRVAEGDPALTEARWEGQGIGTGRRRQGNSAEPDRHADPRAELQDRWMEDREAIRNAAEDLDEIRAERRSRTKRGAARGDRTGGAPVAPTGVPKADHVAEPASAETQAVLREQTGRDTSAHAD